MELDTVVTSTLMANAVGARFSLVHSGFGRTP